MPKVIRITLLHQLATPLGWQYGHFERHGIMHLHTARVLAGFITGRHSKGSMITAKTDCYMLRRSYPVA